MHGAILAQFRRFVAAKLPGDAWAKTAQAAEVQETMFLPIKEYADSMFQRLLAAGAKLAGRPADLLLEEFGEYAGPAFLEMYKSLVDPQWKTLDLIEQAEEKIHRVVRLQGAGIRSTYFQVARPSRGEVVLTYTSPRRLCAFAKGVARGIAHHFREKLVVAELSCMKRGEAACRISFKTSAL